MIYTELTNAAMQIAYRAHHSQTDKNNIPYIFHPYHLAEQMDDENSVCVALLHDVVEDTDVTIEELEKTFPPEVIDAIKLMTHHPGEPYLSYIERIKTNSLAKKVKLADLAHNSDETRMPNADAKTLEYYRSKYMKAFEILKGDQE